MQPTVTALIPCYNTTPYVPEVVKALQAQTWPHWEAVFVDDGSTDGDPLAVAASFHDPRIKCVRHALNRGIAAGFNSAFAASSAPTVLMHGSDDLLEPAYFEKTQALLRDEPDVDIVFVDLQTFGATDEVLRFTPREPTDFAAFQWLPSAGATLRRELWLRAGGAYEGPELRHGNVDWDLWLSIAQSGPMRVRYLPETLYRYRRHAANISISRASHEHITRECMYARHKAYIDAQGTASSFRAEGWLLAAETAWNRNERARALELALQGAAIQAFTETPLPSVPVAPGSEAQGLIRLMRELENIAGDNPVPDESAMRKRFTLSLLHTQLGQWNEALPHLEMLLGWALGAQTSWADYLLALYDAARRQGKEPGDESGPLELALAARLPGADILHRECRAALAAGQGNKALFLAWRAVLRATPFCQGQLHVLADTVLSLAAGDETAARRLSQRALALRVDVKPAAAAFKWADCCALALGRRIYWNYRAPLLAREGAFDETGLETLRGVLLEQKPRRALEIGCGSGRVLALLAALGIESLGEDISATALWLARRRKLPGVRLRRPSPRISTAHPGAPGRPAEFFDLLIFRHTARHMPPEELKQRLAAACPTAKAVYLEEPDPPPGHPDLCCFYQHDYRLLLADQGFSRSQPLADDAWLFMPDA